MSGYGCEVNRGVVLDNSKDNIEESLDNIWYKGFFNELEKNNEICDVVTEIGLISGNLEIEINGVLVFDICLKSFEVLVYNETINIDYPKTNDFIITSLQHQEGIFSDTIFVICDEFSLDKIKLVKKNIISNIDNVMIPTLYCELYYDNYLIPTMDSLTDLRMSRLYLENNKKDEKNKNR